MIPGKKKEQESVYNLLLGECCVGPEQSVIASNYGSYLYSVAIFDVIYTSFLRTCAGCHNEIGHGRFLSCMGAVWHPECFCCHACNQPIYDYEVALCCFVYQLSSCIGILTLPKKTCSSPCQETIHTIKLVTRSAFIQNVMSASNL